MRILLVQNSLYYPAYGGGNKSNRLLLEALTAKGHECRVVTRVSETLDSERLRLFLADLESRDVQIDSAAGGLVIFRLNGVEVHTETSLPRVRDHLIRQIREFEPTWTLVSTDDPLQMFLSAALETHPGRVVYLARTSLALPFGPDTAIGSEQRTEALRRVAGIVTVSEYVRRYIETHGGMNAIALPISLHGKGPYPNLACFDGGAVTMVNPCAIKGISIFVELARRLRDVPFAAVPMWGTNESDLTELERQANVSLLPPVDNIDKVLARTRVLLAPSLCNDAKPRIVVEAMSRGIPVLASNVGGVPEAKLGVDYLLPVAPIEAYEPSLDSRMVPEAIVPPQNADPWLEALERLLTDRGHFLEISRQSHEAANRHIASLTVEPFEQYLGGLAGAGIPSTASAVEDSGPARGLSPEKRALLAMRLRSQRKDG
ncbi:MAG: glycosyltransferase family 4 protein [bacterium]|nr:glycosyltransferase family 4 protein [bacterium]